MTDTTGDGTDEGVTGGTSKPHATLLAEYMTEDEFALEIKRSPRTVQRWRRLKIGPPVTWVGKTPMIRRGSARDWLLAQEQAAPRGTTDKARE